MIPKSELQQVTTELLTLEKVSAAGMGFIVPSYQRPYVWSDEDVIKLFADITEAYKDGEPTYFIGSVLSALRDENGGQAYELIDGQQRTTTLMLISLAFRSIGIVTALADVSVLGEQPRLNFEIRNSVLNLLGSYAGLEKLTRPGPETIQNDVYLTHLDANLRVLTQQVLTLKKDAAFNLEAFAEYLYRQVCWVNNIVPERMDLNRLFSSMNTAGIQLEPVDLLKAKLLRKISTEKALYSTIWQACEHIENYFERNLRQLFPSSNWNALDYHDIQHYDGNVFGGAASNGQSELRGKTLATLLEEVMAGDAPENPRQPEPEDTQTDIDDETVYCRSVVGFELLLIHALRVFCVRQDWPDLEPRIKAANLMACFECLLEQDEAKIKAFIELLWQVRYQFDSWVVKWVEHDDREDPQLRLTTISRSKSGGNTYLNRSAKELGALVQLQAVRNFTGDRSAQYWLTAFLARLVKYPSMKEEEVLSTLELLDNQLSLTTETQKIASFQIAKGETPATKNWMDKEHYFGGAEGTGFEHYWFQKLEYLLWKYGDKSDDKLMRYRITSKNSVEHVHPQNEEYKTHMPKEHLNAFGNLVLLSPGENSSYSNQAVRKKKADFESKPRYDSLKLKAIFELHSEREGKWGLDEITMHQQRMVKILRSHYTQGTQPIIYRQS